MIRSLSVLLLLVCLAVFVLFAQQKASVARHNILYFADLEGGGVIPGPVLKLASLEFDGLLADQLFLRCLTFTGRMQEDAFQGDGEHKSEENSLLNNPRRWDWFSAQLDAVVHLDPYFFDPYFIGHNSLVWTAGRYREANRLADKGVSFRSWDWILPFNAGFTEFYFLDDKSKGAEYLMLAAARPGAPELLATLAARLAYEENQTANAIIFLKQQLRNANENDPGTSLQRERLSALEGVFIVEQAVEKYRSIQGRNPSSIEDLIATGVLKSLPQDPYGGQYYLDDSARVHVTSDLGRGGG